MEYMTSSAPYRCPCLPAPMFFLFGEVFEGVGRGLQGSGLSCPSSYNALEIVCPLLLTKKFSTESHYLRVPERLFAKGKLECYNEKMEKEMLGGYKYLIFPIL